MEVTPVSTLGSVKLSPEAEPPCESLLTNWKEYYRNGGAAVGQWMAIRLETVLRLGGGSLRMDLLRPQNHQVRI